MRHSDAIVQSVREPLLVLDRQLCVQLANRSFYKTFRVTPQETQGRLLYELGDGQWDIPELHTLLDGVLATEGTEFNEFEVEHDFADIGPRTMLLNARLIEDGGGSQPILLVLEDITERRRLEREAHAHQQWFQVTLGSIGDAVIATDPEARVTFMNPSAEKLTGWAQQEAVGRPLAEVFNIVNEETRHSVESPVVKAVREGAVVGLANHTLLIAKDGQEWAIDDSAAPIRDSTGAIIGVVMVFHDITQRRREEHLLEISEVRYRRLFEAAHDGILLVNPKSHKIIDVNPFLIKLLGYPRDHFLSRELWEIGFLRDKAASVHAMRELQEKGSVRYENLPLEDRHGHKHPVEMVANMYKEGRRPIIQCNIRDISERRNFEREREALLVNEQAARLEAQAANCAKDLFLATLSHEIRTPLSAILGWTSMLRRRHGGEGYEAELKEGLLAIHNNAKAQAQLIEDVLDVSRIVSGKLHLEFRRCDLAEVVSAAIDTVRPAALAKGIELHKDIDPLARSMTGDPSRLQQIIWNLLSNAIKFTPEGGTVRVQLAREPSAVCIRVTDTGQGIAADFLPFVFDRFRQAHSDAKASFGGLGLGLSIVRQLTDLHGGTVRAQSEGPGRGATFIVRLPIPAVQEGLAEDVEPNVSFTSAIEELPAIRLDGMRILIVDDEAEARRIIVKTLQAVGATVTAAASAAEALDLVKRLHPHVLVSDLGMPGQDGYELIQRIRSAGHTAKDLPAVALTALAHSHHQRRALFAGFQVHVSKPVDPADLPAVIANLAGRIGG